MRVTPSARDGAARHTNTAYFTMVALDEDGRPTAVPPLRPAETDDEQRREREAQLRRATASRNVRTARGS